MTSMMEIVKCDVCFKVKSGEDVRYFPELILPEVLHVCNDCMKKYKWKEELLKNFLFKKRRK